MAVAVNDLFDRDYDQEIQDAVAVLDPHQFPISTWTSVSICQMHISVAKWLRSLEIVLSISDPDELAQTLEIGYLRGFWIENASCTPRQLYDFCRWLRSPDGMKAKNDVYLQLCLERKPKTVLSASEKKRTIPLHYEVCLQLQMELLNLEEEIEEEIQKLQDEEDKMNKLQDEVDKMKKDRNEMNNHIVDVYELWEQIPKLLREMEENQKLQDKEDKIKKWLQEELHVYEVRMCTLHKQILHLQEELEEETQKLQYEKDKMKKDQKKIYDHGARISQLQKQILKLDEEMEEEIPKFEGEKDEIKKDQKEISDHEVRISQLQKQILKLLSEIEEEIQLQDEKHKIKRQQEEMDD